MLALVAVLLANADGRSGIMLSRLVSARRDRRLTVGIAFSAFIVNAVIAAIAGAIANRMIGQGVAALLVALAMLSAAAALLWRVKLLPDPVADDASPPILAGRMLANQFGDRSHFLIGALAATSGAGQWAAAGDWSAGRWRCCLSSPSVRSSLSGARRATCAGRLPRF